MKQSGTPIENLVRWAYRDELPKEGLGARRFLRPLAFGSPWASVTKAGVLGTDIQEPDIRNRFGVTPDLTAQTAPHPDAVRIWHEVQELGGLELDLPPDWYPLSDMGDLGPLGKAAVAKGLDAVALRSASGKRLLRQRYEPSYLVAHCAIMGAPEWRFPKPAMKLASHENGKPRWFMRQMIETDGGPIEIEVDGFNQRAHRPHDGAYQKRHLDPDPAAAVEARAEYEIWLAALGLLVERLTGALDAHWPLPPEALPQPWEGAAKAAGAILDDRNARQPRGRVPRPRSDRPLSRKPILKPMRHILVEPTAP